ncbi:probable pectinesterase/pectinesterase inhibitor 12 [Telopea speciosissima]|uniref:probable pectinesterase/pectinesterase inhibitor 12 n=1 Tax=Telopea speciosissima TaxID=54955 RepID=UPI001CC44213|nr:probable pectinesterase/pectinesterase inhibitor 12 [Telopea speciosissima]
MASFLFKTLILLSAILFTSSSSSSSLSSSSLNINAAQVESIRSVCKSTPYPDVCYNSMKLSISINLNLTTLIDFALQSLNIAAKEAGKLTDLILEAGNSQQIVEKQRGAIQDCKELHQISVSTIQKCMSRIHQTTVVSHMVSDAKAYLSAALTNKNTCLEGLESATGPLKPVLVNGLVSTYNLVSNSLSIVSKMQEGGQTHQEEKSNGGRRLMGFPVWMKRRDRRLLELGVGEKNEYATGDELTVAADGTGNFKTITEAINFAPNNSYDVRTIIYVREGVYQENVEIPSYKPNIVLLGDGADVTMVTGNRSVGDGWTTFRSATLAVSGDGFMARDITFENTAGPEKHQAVALRVNADLTAVYRCVINGYQDTLYVHSFRQFYRECDISGTVDFIFGNAAVVFQASTIIARLPLPGQFNAITAQSRDNSEENTGISIQNCSIVASDDLYNNNNSTTSNTIKSYLGRPWRIYSRTVYLESYIDDFIDPAGWIEWSGELGLDTLYYGEYDNSGPGSGVENRVTWPGYHVMDYDEASNFIVSQLITGDEWLDSTSVPYDNGVWHMYVYYGRENATRSCVVACTCRSDTA